MTLYKFYKHTNTRDTAICPIEIRFLKDGLQVTFDIFNVHYNELGVRVPFLIYPDYERGEKPQTMNFTHEQLKDWKEYVPSENFGILRETKTS